MRRERLRKAKQRVNNRDVRLTRHQVCDQGGHASSEAGQKNFERSAALQPVGQRNMHHCASRSKLVGGGVAAAGVCGFDQSCVHEGRQANWFAYASISCLRAPGKLSFVTVLQSLAMALI